uniref:Uncharacterized protein n=1 Tax=Oryza nivara TaxID=4536 RepID=A0A0E0HY04_ORYNI
MTCPPWGHRFGETSSCMDFVKDFSHSPLTVLSLERTIPRAYKEEGWRRVGGISARRRRRSGSGGGSAWRGGQGQRGGLATAARQGGGGPMAGSARLGAENVMQRWRLGSARP